MPRMCQIQDIPDSGGTFVFETPPLEKAGTWTVTAEYKEMRPELARALPKKEAFLRSSALLIHVSEPLEGFDALFAVFQNHHSCVEQAIFVP
jgi:hypothetical protein